MGHPIVVGLRTLYAGAPCRMQRLPIADPGVYFFASRKCDMLSSSCTYGLRAVVYLAAEPTDGFVPVRRIADALAISPTFLSKVFHGLATAGLVDTYRGPNGGVRLARAAESISVRDVVTAVDGPGLFTGCVLGLPGCGEQKPCPMHARWAEIRARIEWSMQEESIAKLAEGYRSGDRRLSPEMPVI